MNLYVDFDGKFTSQHSYDASLRIRTEEGKVLAEATGYGGEWEAIAMAAGKLFLNENFAGNAIASALLAETLVKWALGHGYSVCYQTEKDKRKRRKSDET